ncbi:unnamed protein product, partial [Coffea canephora]
EVKWGTTGVKETWRKFPTKNGLKLKKLDVVRNPFVILSTRSNALTCFLLLPENFDLGKVQLLFMIWETSNIDVILDPFQSGETVEILAETSSNLQGLTESPMRSLADIIAFNMNNPDFGILESFGNFDGRKIFIAADFTNGIGEEERKSIEKKEKLSRLETAS